MLRNLLVVAFVSCVTTAHAAASIDPYVEPKSGLRTGANETVELRVKRCVDRYRQAVGLPAVALDAKLSKGCMEHANYMRLNRDSDAMAGLNAHQQRPKLRGASSVHRRLCATESLEQIDLAKRGPTHER